MPVLLARESLVLEEELVVVLCHTELVPPLFEHEHVVEADAVALRVHVELADAVRLVPVVPERLCHGGQVGHRESLVEDAVAVRA